MQPFTWVWIISTPPHPILSTHCSYTPDVDALAAQRTSQTRASSRGLAVDRRTLADALRAHKRALAAVQLSETRAVEEALSAAPEALRVMGLAYRVYILAAPMDPAAATAGVGSNPGSGSRGAGGRNPGMGGSGGTGGVSGVDLATALQPSFRVYLDPPSLQVC